jgi:hypothetical protein
LYSPIPPAPPPAQSTPTRDERVHEEDIQDDLQYYPDSSYSYFEDEEDRYAGCSLGFQP